MVLACGDDEPEPVDSYVDRVRLLEEVELRRVDLDIVSVDNRVELRVGIDHAGVYDGFSRGKLHECPTFSTLQLSFESGGTVRSTPFMNRGGWRSTSAHAHWCEPPLVGLAVGLVPHGEVGVVMVHDESMTLRLELGEPLWRRELALRDKDSWDFFAREPIVLRWSVVEDLSSVRSIGLGFRISDREVGWTELFAFAPDLYQGNAPTAERYGAGVFSLNLSRRNIPCEVIAPISAIGCRVAWYASFRRPGSLRQLP